MPSPRYIGKISPIFVDTIQDLRDFPVSNVNKIPEYVSVRGYYATGDGGGGPNRYWASGAAPGTYVDNGGSIIVPTDGDGSAAWLWAYSGPVQTKWFGCKADGVTDDTVALQAAMLACPDLDLSDGDHYCTASLLFLHDGGYLHGKGAVKFATSKAIFVYNCDDVTVSDITIKTVNGYSGVVVRTNSDPGSVPYSNKPAVPGQVFQNLLIRNITVDNFSSGNKPAEFGNHCIEVKSFEDTAIKNVKIVGNTLLGAGYDPVVNNLNGRDNIYVSSYSDSSEQMDGVVISGNYCRYAGRNNISLATDSGFPIKNATITGNICLDSTLSGLDLEQGELVSVSGNNYVRCGTYTGYYDPDTSSNPTTSMRSGITAHNDSRKSAPVVGCTFTDCYYGISGLDVTATGCRFDNSPLSLGTFSRMTGIFTSCRFESSENRYMVRFYAPANYRNPVFSDCEFVDTLTTGRTLRPFFINSDGASLGIRMTGCTFISSYNNGVGFVRIENEKLWMVNCAVKLEATRLFCDPTLTSDLHMTDCNVACGQLWNPTVTGSYRLYIDRSLLAITKLSSEDQSTGTLSLLHIDNCDITVTEQSDVPISASLKLSNNKITMSSVADGSSFVYSYPQNAGSFPTVVSEIVGNTVIGFNSTKTLVEMNTGASALGVIVNATDNYLALTNDAAITNGRIATVRDTSPAARVFARNYYHRISDPNNTIVVL